MSEKFLKVTILSIFIISFILLYFSIKHTFIFGALVSVIGVLYGGIRFLKLELDKPFEEELDPYDAAVKLQQSKIKAECLRKKIKIVKK